MIRYLKGDATSPQAKGTKFIVHICNTEGKWGAGFVMAVSRRWPITRDLFLRWYNGKLRKIECFGHVECSFQSKFALGAVQFVHVQRDVVVCNMVAQKGIKTGSSGPPIRYDALKRCLTEVANEVRSYSGTVRGYGIERSVSIHMPRIGCGLAGGKWELVEPLARDAFAGLDVCVYDLGGQ